MFCKMIFQPAGRMEEYFKKVSEGATKDLKEEDWARFNAEFGVKQVDPPITYLLKTRMPGFIKGECTSPCTNHPCATLETIESTSVKCVKTAEVWPHQCFSR